jgi:hypothetical protein
MNALVSPYFADASVIYYRAMVQAASTTTATPFGFRFYNDNEGTLTSQGYTGIISGFMAIHGSASQSTSIPFAAGTWHYVCGKFQIATASGADNGQHIINVSPTPDPADGSVTGVTNGTSYLPINRVYLAQQSANAMLIDMVKISTEVISECGAL